MGGFLTKMEKRRFKGNNGGNRERISWFVRVVMTYSSRFRWREREERKKGSGWLWQRKG